MEPSGKIEIYITSLLPPYMKIFKRNSERQKISDGDLDVHALTYYPFLIFLFLPLRGWVPAIFPIFILFPIKFSTKYIPYFQNSQKHIFGFFLKTAKSYAVTDPSVSVLNLVIFSTIFLYFF